MRHYAVYGACLASEVDFPELPPSDAVAAKWRLMVAPGLPAALDAMELGSERLYGDVHARLFAHRDGHRISIDDTGEFDLSTDGRALRWRERVGAWPDFVRAHSLGRVLATSMYLDGWLPLHGSAVATADGVLAFLAPKGFGKSSLALALTAQGARLVTDDTLPVEVLASGAVLGWPGVQSLRLHQDSLTELGLVGSGETTRDGKLVVSAPAGSQLLREPAPLAAIYLLDPQLPGDGVVAARVALTETMAAIGVVAHVKIGRMLGASAAPAMLARAASIVRTVPVYHLAAARDLARLPEVARQILDWHKAGA